MNEKLVVFEADELRDYIEQLRPTLRPSVKERLDWWRGGLRELIVMMSRAKHIYAMDSGPAHIAAALGVPTTVFFGPRQTRIYSAGGRECRDCRDRRHDVPTLRSLLLQQHGVPCVHARTGQARQSGSARTRCAAEISASLPLFWNVRQQ